LEDPGMPIVPGEKKSAKILSPSGVAAQEAAVADCFDPPSERFLGAK